MVERNKTTWEKIRMFFLDLHLWMGLASGLIVIVVCFTGTVYVFNTEFREAASPELYQLDVPANGTPLQAEEIIAKVQSGLGGSVTMLKISHDPERPWQVSVKKNEANERAGGPSGDKRKSEAGPTEGKGSKKGEAGGKAPEPRKGGRPNVGTTYAVNQYNGDIIGDISNEKNGTTEFMRAMFSLHRWLMLDRIEEPLFGELPNRTLGSYISGTATILFTLGVITGMVIWFPRKVKAWKQGLRIKWDANWKRINHDLHNTLAFYSLIFLFLMGITGPQWSFPWYREGLQKTLGTYSEAPRPEPPKSDVANANAGMPKPLIADYLKVANQTLSYSGDYTIMLAQDSAAAVAVNKTRKGFFASPASDKLVLDQYTASVLDVDVFRDKPFNERVAGSIKALHTGEVYGTFTKILYFIACLIATSLPITGTLIWINKLSKRKKKAGKKVSKEKTIPSVASA